MQLFIVILLICSAGAYLLLKWLPKKQTQYLSSWLTKKAPRLNGILNMSNNTCSDGCSSCGGCERPEVEKNSQQQMKIIKIFPNSSRLN